MSLETPIAIRTLQRKRYQKAKQEPGYRCYLLYDKVYRKDFCFMPTNGRELTKGHRDGQTFGQIEAHGLAEWLEGIREELRARTYGPQPVRRILTFMGDQQGFPPGQTKGTSE